MTDSTPAPTPRPAPIPGQPYCGVCGYALAGAVATSVCPECGTPLVECLVRGSPRFGRPTSRRYTSPIHVFGLPVLQIAFGPDLLSGETKGRAKALIAMGDQAYGGIAIGGVSVGVVAFGGMSVGGFTMGGVSLGLVTAAGGLAAGTGLSAGGCAVGALAIGGMGAGYGAVGGMAVGRYAYGGVALGQHAIGRGAPLSSDPATAAFFKETAWFFGSSPTTPGATLTAGWQAALCVIGLDLLAAGAILLIALWAKMARGSKAAPTPAP